MNVKQLISILNQFDPEDRVIIDAGGAVLMPCDIKPCNGRILINAYSEQFYAKGTSSTATAL